VSGVDYEDPCYVIFSIFMLITFS